MATILIVDDHPLNLAVLTALLSHFGHTLVEARDGVEALEQAKKFQPQLVISDMLMPNMDGVEFVKWMREDPSLARTPVIFYTASYRMREARALAESCGVQLVLSKPAQPAEILKMVSAALGTPVPSLPDAAPPAGGAGVLRAASVSGGAAHMVESIDECMLTLHELNSSMNAILERGLKLMEGGGEMRRMSVDYDAAMYNLGSVSMRMTLLVEYGMDLSRERDPDQLLRLFTAAVQDVLSSRCGGTFLFGDRHGVEKARCLKGMGAGLSMDLASPDYGAGPFRAALQDRRVRQATAAELAAGKLGLPDGHPPVKSLLVAPIISGDEVLGIFYVSNRLGEGEYDLNDQMIAATLASQFAFAYSNLQLFRELHDLNEGLERRVRERTSDLQDANRDLEAFVGAVAHDLMQPAWVLESLSGQLQGHAAVARDPEIGAEVTQIHEVAVNMRELIKDLLALSHTGRRELKTLTTEMQGLVQEVIAEHRTETERQHIHWQLCTLPVLDCDPSLLRIALQNLLSNAIKFTRKRESPQIEIGSQAGEPGETVIYVRDNGAGFDPEHAEKLFGVFQRLHQQSDFEGNGIGLATVARIIKKHGGRVWAEGVPDQGATFYMALPQKSSPAAAAH
jgi:signal transduction histidine kinase/CheY-like chemotaxis protein